MLKKEDSIWFYLFLLLILMEIGGMANSLVITANDCKMPVRTEILDLRQDKCYFAVSEPDEANLGVLGDIYHIQTKNKDIYYSIGDVLLFVGGIGGLFVLGKRVIKLVFKNKQEGGLKNE
jgi:hypothetical protein